MSSHASTTHAISLNPATGKVFAEYPFEQAAELEQSLSRAAAGFKAWRKQPISARAEQLRTIAKVLRKNAEAMAQMMTAEMGKPIAQSRGEVEKTAVTCEWYAENGPAIDVLREQAVEAGQLAPRYHAQTRPAALEAEAVHRVTRLAEVAGAPIYIVHLSSAEGLSEVVRARARGVRALAETCPQYLFLDEDCLALPGFEGASYVCSPPLRPKEDQEALWKGLSDRYLQNVATDHCPFCRDQRLHGVDDFRKIPNGLPGVEHRLEQIFHGGVAGGKFSLNRWVEICSTAPAKIFGLYPRKGTLAPGADADVVIFDPHAGHLVSAKTHHMNVDYSAYEGQTLSGAVRTVLLRGKVIVDDGRYNGAQGDGCFLARGLSITES